MNIDVVVPVYNQIGYLSRMLETLVEHTPNLGRVILVDDASSPATSVWLNGYAEGVDNVDLLRHGANTRFSRSANDGISVTRSPLVALLNSDVELTAGWADALMAPYFTDNGSSVAVVGCVQVSPEGFGLHTGFRGHADMWTPANEPYEVDWVTGCAWLINRDAWQRIGPLREDVDGETGIDYRHFESDREWCFRAKKSGYRVLCSPHKIVHHWQRSTPVDWQHT